ncbi:bacillithiol biosynthesis cysteine-adding enzyme BshC [Caldalkalibacillus mannanilyticus]|uniref:bacillithiol biosynthesis cysteine-adding enzyme BshC n=1 Tax=Caldalkalibacillus mannanilyticus TaxID=1418 RepID=UPI00046A5FFA|nr:bacillithiol biosynthesis cysteine-adding enzyme BshC [Caldalkalibacillus mannanilyticus]
MTSQVKDLIHKQIDSFGTAYIQRYEGVSSFFSYSPFEQASFHERVKELSERSYDRIRLAKVIRDYMSRYGLVSEQEEQLKKMTDPKSVMVIGGQQAGLLLGPLYTLYKMITVLQLAQQQERELQVPVIPLFWIAGEDHDWLEVNHVFIPQAESPRLERMTLEDPYHSPRTSLSQQNLPKVEVAEWVEQFLQSQPETEFTGELRGYLRQAIEQANTYVEFFAFLVQQFFSKQGLLFIDSGAREMREIEGPVFERIITNYDTIDSKVRESIQEMEKVGYTAQIQLGDSPAFLFIYEQNQRLLLEKTEGGFRTKDGTYTYSEQELIALARKEPWRFSNNVVTRAYMQENIFPTLSFVAGPGEISYWALFRRYFEELGCKLPILAPRISITIIEKSISRIVEKREIPLEAVFQDFATYKREWLTRQDHIQLEASFEQVKEKIKGAYQPLVEKLQLANLGLDGLAEQNIGKIIEQVNFLEKRALASFTKQHESALRHFDKVEQALYPHGKPQERMHNLFTFLNKHGMVLIDRIIESEYEINGIHKLFYMD